MYMGNLRACMWGLDSQFLGQFEAINQTRTRTLQGVATPVFILSHDYCFNVSFNSDDGNAENA